MASVKRATRWCQNWRRSESALGPHDIAARQGGDAVDIDAVSCSAEAEHVRPWPSEVCWSEPRRALSVSVSPLASEKSLTLSMPLLAWNT